MGIVFDKLVRIYKTQLIVDTVEMVKYETHKESYHVRLNTDNIWEGRQRAEGRREGRR